MRRFLSWIVIPVLLFLYDLLNDFVGACVYYIFWDKMSFAGSIIVLLLSGGTILGILAILSALLEIQATIIVKISQAVWKSKKGTRYIVFSVIYALLYSFIIYIAATGILVPKSGVIIYGVIGILFSILFAIYGKATAKEDGAPLSKVERLERKIEKLKMKEEKTDSTIIEKSGEN